MVVFILSVIFIAVLFLRFLSVSQRKLASKQENALHPPYKYVLLDKCGVLLKSKMKAEKQNKPKKMMILLLEAHSASAVAPFWLSASLALHRLSSLSVTPGL